MSYNFDFRSLPLRVVIPSKRVPIKEEVEKEIDPVVETQYHSTVYVKVTYVPDTPPENCTAIYHTNMGTWLELDVGPASEIGVRELPKNIQIIRIIKLPIERLPEQHHPMQQQLHRIDENISMVESLQVEGQNES